MAPRLFPPPSRRHLGSQLCELERLIDKMMVEDFTMYARSDLSRSLREEPQVLEKVREQQHGAQKDPVFICLQWRNYRTSLKKKKKFYSIPVKNKVRENGVHPVMVCVF